jgi:hypothetical protein
MQALGHPASLQPPFPVLSLDPQLEALEIT